MNADDVRANWPIFTHPDCPPDTMYFLPTGSHGIDLASGKTLELAPGYWVNPKQVGKIADLTLKTHPKL